MKSPDSTEKYTAEMVITREETELLLRHYLQMTVLLFEVCPDGMSERMETGDDPILGAQKRYIADLERVYGEME
jgi:hypothetical protein